MGIERTVVISCAGMGNRLGLHTTKALIEVDGKTLIRRHLELLQDEKDIRVVVGYQADSVIEEVQKYRKDVTFVYNHDYATTKTGDSVVLAAKGAKKYLLSLDGDLLIHPEDMKKILECDHEFVSGGDIESDEPWMVQIFEEEDIEYAKGFSKESGAYEWNGITQIESEKILNGTGHVFQLVEPFLPVPFLEIRTREIDTMNDYERAVAWVKNGFC